MRENSQIEARGDDRSPLDARPGSDMTPRARWADMAERSPRAVARLIRGRRKRASGTGNSTDDPGATDLVEPAQAPVRFRSRRSVPQPDRGETPRHAVRTKPRARPVWIANRRATIFGLAVVLPLFLLAAYMVAVARPQYVSTVAFTVRSMETGAVNEALAGFAQVAGGVRSTDALILAEFLESQTLLERLNMRLDLVRHYAEPHSIDPVFALAPDATIEARLRHWRRMLAVRSDPATGLVELRIHAFSPEMAQLIARELLVESRTLLNDLNAEARAATTAQAEAELDTARTRLAQARAELTAFRAESRMFDPNTDFEGRMGVLRLLQGQLAQALVDQDVQAARTETDRSIDETPRVVALRQRIEVERDRLIEGLGDRRGDYPQILASHEHLTAERDYAELAYRSARTARDMAQARAAQNDLFLAVFVQPTLPERADHEISARIIGLAALFLGLSWAIGALARAAILDRR
jgi:capsular polysaccharide transport system permease protein